MSTLRANTSFNVGTLIVHRGDLVDSGSSIIKGREHLFDAVEVAVLSPRALETASATPGTKRSRGRGRGKGKPAETTPPPADNPPVPDPADQGQEPDSEAETDGDQTPEGEQGADDAKTDGEQGGADQADGVTPPAE